MSVCLGRFMERIDMLPTTQFAYRKGLGTCDALLCVSHTLQSAFESGQRLGSCRFSSVQPLIGSTIWIFSISSTLLVLEVLSCQYCTQFSAAFDRVNHLDILYKLCSVGIGGSVLSILTQFLSNRSQHVMVDGCQSKLIYFLSGVRRAVFWALIPPGTPVHFRAFFHFGK